MESPVFGRKSATQSPLRKALSLINSNASTKLQEKQSDTDEHCPVLEPKTPFTATCTSNKFQPIGTPLDKFSARSTSFKVYEIEVKLNIFISFKYLLWFSY